MAKEPVILPEKYYLDYFNYVLAFVEKQYDHILDAPEHLFYQSFRGLSEQAQCLFLRFSNRKGEFFRVSKVSYSEIPDLHEAKEELLHHSFIRINESNDLNQFKLFTKSELTSQFDFLDPTLKKEHLLDELNEHDLTYLHESEEIAELQKTQEVDFIKLLFFGNTHGKMTEFVIRDVGNIKVENLNESSLQPWFSSREEALSVMHIAQLKRMIYELQDAGLSIEEYIDEMPWKTWLSYHRSSKQAEKLILKIAYHFEQIQLPEKALAYYSLITKSPSRERSVRILEKLARKDEAIQLANKIAENPQNATESTFASDFLKRKGIRIDRSMTARLKGAPSIDIPKPDISVERAVLEYFENQGWNGFHAENFLWRGIFGLTFWPIIFDTSQGAFHHPLQRQPSDLNDHSFFETRSDQLEALLKSLRSKKQLIKHVTAIHDKKQGIANRFVTWHESLLESTKTMVDHLPLSGLKKVLIEMSKNMKENSAGFPDLFLWKEADYQFYEVKSPNDHLSAQQLFWLNFLSSAKIKVDILRVNYLED